MAYKEEIKRATLELHQLADDRTAKLAAWVDDMNAAQVGVAADIVIESSQVLNMAFEKIHGRWTLTINGRAFRECSMLERIDAAMFLPLLEQRMVAVLTEYLKH